MKYKQLFSLLTCLAVFPLLAETYDQENPKFSVAAPEEFTQLAQTFPENEVLGQIKVLYLAPDVTTTGGSMIIHHMKVIPFSQDYDTFKSSISKGMADFFGDDYKEVKQEDLKGDLKGFSIEYLVNGSEMGPDPNGTIPLHLRWYLVRVGENELVGVIYSSLAEKWEELEPKFKKSFDSLKLDKKA